MTENEQKVRLKTLAEIRRLHACLRQARIECEEWKDRYEAERADHLATLRHTNKMLAEDYP